MIGVVGHEVGNIGSIKNVLDALQAPYQMVQSVNDLRRCERLVLPGVGAFDRIIDYLSAADMLNEIRAFAQERRPILAICLGMQALFEASEEGSRPGLGIVRSPIRHLRSMGCKDKIPHVGFNTLHASGTEPDHFWTKFDGKDFYFVHSFAAPMGDWTNAVDEYTTTVHGGVTFVSAFRQGSILAAQFHPEKSGESGLELVSAFITC